MCFVWLEPTFNCCLIVRVFCWLQHGLIPLELAASENNFDMVVELFLKTSRIEGIVDWTVAGVLAHYCSEEFESKVFSRLFSWTCGIFVTTGYIFHFLVSQACLIYSPTNVLFKTDDASTFHFLIIYQGFLRGILGATII